MKKKTIKVGIMPKEQYKKRTIDIAKGIYKPKKDEPKIWFESIKSMSQILSNENQELLKVIDIRGKKIEDIFKMVRRSVYELSNKKQTPWENSSIFDDFYFLKN